MSKTDIEDCDYYVLYCCTNCDEKFSSQESLCDHARQCTSASDTSWIKKEAEDEDTMTSQPLHDASSDSSDPQSQVIIKIENTIDKAAGAVCSDQGQSSSDSRPVESSHPQPQYYDAAKHKTASEILKSMFENKLRGTFVQNSRVGDSKQVLSAGSTAPVSVSTISNVQAQASGSNPLPIAPKFFLSVPFTQSSSTDPSLPKIERVYFSSAGTAKEKQIPVTTKYRRYKSRKKTKMAPAASTKSLQSRDVPQSLPLLVIKPEPGHDETAKIAVNKIVSSSYKHEQNKNAGQISTTVTSPPPPPLIGSPMVTDKKQRPPVMVVLPQTHTPSQSATSSATITFPTPPQNVTVLSMAPVGPLGTPLLLPFNSGVGGLIVLPAPGQVSSPAASQTQNAQRTAVQSPGVHVQQAGSPHVQTSTGSIALQGGITIQPTFLQHPGQRILILPPVGSSGNALQSVAPSGNMISAQSPEVMNQMVIPQSSGILSGQVMRVPLTASGTMPVKISKTVPLSAPGSVPVTAAGVIPASLSGAVSSNVSRNILVRTAGTGGVSEASLPLNPVSSGTMTCQVAVSQNLNMPTQSYKMYSSRPTQTPAGVSNTALHNHKPDEPKWGQLLKTAQTTNLLQFGVPISLTKALITQLSPDAKHNSCLLEMAKEHDRLPIKFEDDRVLVPVSYGGPWTVKENICRGVKKGLEKSLKAASGEGKQSTNQFLRVVGTLFDSEAPLIIRAKFICLSDKKSMNIQWILLSQEEPKVIWVPDPDSKLAFILPIMELPEAVTKQLQESYRLAGMLFTPPKMPAIYGIVKFTSTKKNKCKPFMKMADSESEAKTSSEVPGADAVDDGHNSESHTLLGGKLAGHLSDLQDKKHVERKLLAVEEDNMKRKSMQESEKPKSTSHEEQEKTEREKSKNQVESRSPKKSRSKSDVLKEEILGSKAAEVQETGSGKRRKRSKQPFSFHRKTMPILPKVENDQQISCITIKAEPTGASVPSLQLSQQVLPAAIFTGIPNLSCTPATQMSLDPQPQKRHRPGKTSGKIIGEVLAEQIGERKATHAFKLSQLLLPRTPQSVSAKPCNTPLLTVRVKPSIVRHALDAYIKVEKLQLSPTQLRNLQSRKHPEQSDTLKRKLTDSAVHTDEPPPKKTPGCPSKLSLVSALAEKLKKEEADKGIGKHKGDEGKPLEHTYSENQLKRKCGCPCKLSPASSVQEKEADEGIGSDEGREKDTFDRTYSEDQPKTKHGHPYVLTPVKEAHLFPCKLLLVSTPVEEPKKEDASEKGGKHERSEGKSVDHTYSEKQPKRKRGRPRGRSSMIKEAEQEEAYGGEDSHGGKTHDTIIRRSLRIFLKPQLDYAAVENRGIEDLLEDVNDKDRADENTSSESVSVSRGPENQFACGTKSLGKHAGFDVYVEQEEEEEEDKTEVESDAEDLKGKGKDLEVPEDKESQDSILQRNISKFQILSEEDGEELPDSEEADAKVSDWIIYFCKICGAFRSKSKKACVGHLLLHETGALDCQQCSFQASSKQELKEHIALEHTGKPLYSCDACLMAFFSYPVFKNHLRRHSTENSNSNLMFICNVCGRDCNNEEFLESHSKRCFSVYRCCICDVGWATINQLKLHALRKHKVKLYACPKCCQSFTSESEHISHKMKCPKLIQ